MNLSRSGLWQLALFKLLHDLILIGVDIGVVHELVELLHIDGVVSFVNEDIGVLNLSLKVLHLVLIETTSLHLIEVKVIDETLILAAKRLIRNFIRVKLSDEVIVEFEPSARPSLALSVLNI